METSSGTSRATFTTLYLGGESDKRYRLRADAFRKPLHRDNFLQFPAVTLTAQLNIPGLVRDNKGNLFGTTQLGGGTGCYQGLGCGTIFELTYVPGVGWAKHQLYKFQNGPPLKFIHSAA